MAEVIATLLLVLPAAAAPLYVAPNGSDTNSGTRTRPFATLERARDEVRRLKQNGKMPKDGLTIWLRGGDYLRTNTLELAAADSGTSKAPIVWRACKGETVRLLGGRKLPAFEPVTDPAILARLPEAAHGHVVQVDLKALGITDFGQMHSRGFSRPITTAHCELFYGGRPMTLARWPNEGQWEHITGYLESGMEKNEHGQSVGKLEEGFTFSGDRPHGWKDTSDVWVHGYWAWDWADSYEHVASIDLEQHLIKTAPPYGVYNFRKGQRFYFLNILEELDQPGEWFLDHKTGVLYFWPPSSSQFKVQGSKFIHPPQVPATEDGRFKVPPPKPSSPSSPPRSSSSPTFPMSPSVASSSKPPGAMPSRSAAAPATSSPAASSATSEITACASKAALAMAC